MEQRRKNRILEDRHFENIGDGSDSDNEHKSHKKTLATSLLDKLNFDNIPDDVPFGFKPMGIPANPFEGKVDMNDSDSDNEDEDPGDVQQFRISDYNDIYKQVEKDLNTKVKPNGSKKESAVMSVAAEKVSFPLAPGQNLASLAELTKDLENARKAQNHYTIVSLCSSCAKKAQTSEEKIKFLAEKFRSLEVLKLPKL